MNNLVFNCSNELPSLTAPACPTDYGERIIAVAFMKEGGTFPVVSSDYPTCAEFQDAVSSGDIVVLSGISNGERIKQGATTLSGHDTVTGGEEEYDKVYRIQGRIKVFNEAIKAAVKKIDRYSEMRCWFFTDKDYCYGGQSGYPGVPNFDDVIIEGKGNPPYIPFRFDYTSIGLDQAGYDYTYSLLW